MAGFSTWLKRWRRLFKNRRVDGADVKAVLPQAALDRLTARIAASEQQHSGEIRVCIEAGLPWSYICRDATVRDRALTLFGKLRVWDTEHNNGVLIYLLIAEHAIEIIADRGLNVRISLEQWSGITAELSQALSSARFEEGLTQAIEALSVLLSTYFPANRSPQKLNELPDEPVILG